MPQIKVLGVMPAAWFEQEQLCRETEGLSIIDRLPIHRLSHQQQNSCWHCDIPFHCDFYGSSSDYLCAAGPKRPVDCHGLVGMGRRLQLGRIQCVCFAAAQLTQSAQCKTGALA